jgi:hypothetical protein
VRKRLIGRRIRLLKLNLPVVGAGWRSSGRSTVCSAGRPSRCSRATAAEELVRLHQAALRRAGGGARLSRPLHPSRRHLAQSPRCSRRARRDPLQGLSPQRVGAVPHNDAQGRRVHQAFPASRFTKGVSSHPPLRATGQRCLQGNIARAKKLMAAPMPEIDPPTARDTADPHTTTDHRPSCPCCGGRMIIVEVFAPGGAPRVPPSSGLGIRTATP